MTINDPSLSQPLSTTIHIWVVGKKIPGGFATPGIFFIFAIFNIILLKTFL